MTPTGQYCPTCGIGELHLRQDGMPPVFVPPGEMAVQQLRRHYLSAQQGLDALRHHLSQMEDVMFAAAVRTTHMARQPGLSIHLGESQE